MDIKNNILIIDKTKEVKDAIASVCKETFSIWHALSGDEGLNLTKNNKFQIVIIDLRSPSIKSIDMIERMKAENPNICVIATTDSSNDKSAVEAIRRGAYDYITEPFNSDDIRIVLSRTAERQRLLEEAGKKEYYRELSIIDGLTGVYNYRYFYEMLPRELERAKRYPQEFSLLMLDIDGFKKFNDSHGHLAGDEMLRKLGHFFKESIRVVDMVFRYGGEEFAVLLPQTPQLGAIAAAKRILNLVRKNLTITVSVGISSFPSDAASKEELIEKADRALYQAKCLGKDRACIYGSEEAV